MCQAQPEVEKWFSLSVLKGYCFKTLVILAGWCCGRMGEQGRSNWTGQTCGQLCLLICQFFANDWWIPPCAYKATGSEHIQSRAYPPSDIFQIAKLVIWSCWGPCQQPVFVAAGSQASLHDAWTWYCQAHENQLQAFYFADWGRIHGRYFQNGEAMSQVQCIQKGFATVQSQACLKFATALRAKRLKECYIMVYLLCHMMMLSWGPRGEGSGEVGALSNFHWWSPRPTEGPMCVWILWVIDIYSGFSH